MRGQCQDFINPNSTPPTSRILGKWAGHTAGHTTEPAHSALSASGVVRLVFPVACLVASDDRRASGGDRLVVASFATLSMF